MSDDVSTEAPEEGEAPEPRDERRDAIVAELSDALGDALVASHVEAGRDIWARVTADSWGEAASVVRNRLGARYFGFLSAIDWMPSPFGRSMDAEVDNVLGTGESPGDDGDSAGEDTGETPDGAGGTGDTDGSWEHGITGGEQRFQVFARVARVGDPGHTWGITLKADVPESHSMPTWTEVYAGADWHERECWEMFGIEFVGHPGLRHIYLPSDFEGNPLRKDFPLLARMVKPWPGIVDVEPLPTDEDES